MRVLAAKNVEQFALDFAGTIEGFVVHAFAKAALVNVGRVEASSGQDIGIHRGAEGHMPANADTHHAEAPRAISPRLHIVERRARVAVVGRNLFGGLERVAAAGSGLIVQEHGSSGFELVIDLRNSFR